MSYLTRHPRTTKILAAVALFLIVLLVIVHTYLASWLLDYVNDVLNNIEGYQGSVESINIDLYRGAYRINKLVLNKKEGKIPTPFISIEVVDFSLQWSALFHGRIVADAELTAPVINFAVKKAAKQTGENVDWTQPIKDLVPIDINHVAFTGGKLTYQDFDTTPHVDVYINNMHGEVSNLRNVVDASKPLPSAVEVGGESIGQGNLHIKGRMNILKDIPDMDILTKLENVHLPALNNYSDAYASFDFKEGNLSIYSELIVKNSHVSGYIKPVAQNISIIDMRKTSNPIKLAWESVVAGIVEIFTNHSKDQFATKIPLEGDLGNIDTDNWATFVGILQNAFVSAFSKGFDQDKQGELPKEKE